MKRNKYVASSKPADANTSSNNHAGSKNSKKQQQTASPQTSIKPNEHIIKNTNSKNNDQAKAKRAKNRIMKKKDRFVRISIGHKVDMITCNADSVAASSISAVKELGDAEAREQRRQSEILFSSCGSAPKNGNNDDNNNSSPKPPKKQKRHKSHKRGTDSTRFVSRIHTTPEAVWSATKLQAWARKIQAESLVWNPNDGMSVTLNHGSKLIQCQLRGLMARKDVSKRRVIRREKLACLRIQASYRGLLGRKRASVRNVVVAMQREQKRLERLREEERRDEAATGIQSKMRQRGAINLRLKLEEKKRIRDEEQKEKERIEMIERAKREMERLEKERIETERATAQAIKEEAERKHKAEMAKVRHIVLLQAAVRTQRVRTRIMLWRRSATIVQSAVRSYQARLFVAELEDQMRRGGKDVKVMFVGGICLAERYLRLQVSRSGFSYLVIGFDLGSCEEYRGLFASSTIHKLVEAYPFGLEGKEKSSCERHLNLKATHHDRVTKLLLHCLTSVESIAGVTLELRTRTGPNALVLSPRAAAGSASRAARKLNEDSIAPDLNKAGAVRNLAIRETQNSCPMPVFVDPLGGYAPDYTFLGRY